jgi:hypothetical protein
MISKINKIKNHKLLIILIIFSSISNFIKPQTSTSNNNDINNDNNNNPIKPEETINESKIYTDIDCINENKKSFDFLNPKTKLIQNPSQCTTKTSKCCYVEITYQYGWTEISNNYCALLTGDINERIQEISGTLTDQSRYYADFTYNNFPTLTSIGNNLDYIYYKDFKCQTPAKANEYYSYSNDNCALKNDDDTCRIVNDEIYFNEYTKLLYSNITANFCNKKNSNGKCLKIEEGDNYNNDEINPLFNYLQENLISNSNNSYFENMENQKDEKMQEIINNNEYSKKFYAKCERVKPANVKIICPETYTSARRVFFNEIFLIFTIFILLV